MTYHQITPPAVEALSLAEAKAHLRLDGNEEDGLIEGLIAAARTHLENTTGLALIHQGFRLYCDDWPDTGMVTLSRGPVVAIDAIRLFDELGDDSLLSLDGTRLDGHGRPARLYLRDRPQPGQALNGIEIDFTAGFGATGVDVPDTLKRAMLTHVALMFEYRGAVAPDMQPAGIPEGYERLVAPYRIRGL